MLDFKAEKAKIAQDKLAKVKEKISVTPRKQPPREAAAAAAAAEEEEEEESECELVHSDSEDIQSESDISNESTDSYGYDEVLKSMVSYCTDSEYQDLLSGVDKEEFNERHKEKIKFLKQPRENPIPILQRFHSTDRYSQKCEIRKKGRQKVLYLLRWGRGRRVVVGLAEGFQILYFL